MATSTTAAAESNPVVDCDTNSDPKDSDAYGSGDDKCGPSKKAKLTK